MWLFCIVFALGVGYIAYRGVNGTTAVNMAINIIQISRVDRVLLSWPSATACSHPRWLRGFHLSNGIPVNYKVDTVNVTDDKGKPVQDTWADNSPKIDDKGQPSINNRTGRSPKTTWTRTRTRMRRCWPA